MAVPCPTQSRRRHLIMGAARCVAVAVEWLVPLASSPCLVAAELRPRSVLVLSQAETTSPFYGASA